jgi:hypothetical protein
MDRFVSLGGGITCSSPRSLPRFPQLAALGCRGIGSLVNTIVEAMGIRMPPAKPWRPSTAIIEPRSCVKAQVVETSGNRIAFVIMAAEGEHAAEVICQWDPNDLADQNGGRNPGAAVDICADAAFDVEQRGVRDLNVEDRHEGADHAGNHGDP